MGSERTWERYKTLDLGRVLTYPDIFQSATVFVSVYGFRPHASGEFATEVEYFWRNPLSTVEKINPQRIH